MTELQLNTIIVFFIYGLAFFSMGLAIALEAGRSPLLAEARVLRPLAVFGLLHGVHEWLEIFILQLQWVEIIIPIYWLWIRLVLLAVSFASLVAYGVQVLRPPERLAAMDAWIGAGLLTLYAALVVLTGSAIWGDLELWIERADVLARYVLAVSGAILAALALFSQARQAHTDNRDALSKSLRWASVGFVLYGLTQVLVSGGNFFPADRLNAALFLEITGVPVQALRALLAMFITAGLIRATQIVEKERQGELEAAQEARFDALQRVQEELVKREDLRRELLRHTVIAQEEERTRIARELHDELAQILTGFSLDLATLKTRCSGDENVTAAVGRLQELSRQMSQGLYQLVHDLRPAQLDDLGLVPALQHLIDDVRSRMKLEITLDISGERQRMDPLVETVFFRVAQEALTNIVRYAKTNQVSMLLEYQPDQTMLQIRDYGVGFDPDALENPQIKLGIAGMRERVRSVDGQFTLESNPGEGTLIKVSVPCTGAQGEEQEERVDENYPTITG